MLIRLLTLPQVNWQELITFGQKALGYSPSKILDDKRIQLDSPRALLVALNNIYNPHDKSFKPTVMRLINLQFIMTCTIEELSELRNYYIGNFTVLTQVPNVFCVCNLSLNDCFQILTMGHKEFDIRRCLNLIYLELKTAQLDCIFDEYTKIESEDQTFYFKKR